MIPWHAYLVTTRLSTLFLPNKRVGPFNHVSRVLTSVTNLEFNFLSFISNLKKPVFASKQDVLELATLRYLLTQTDFIIKQATKLDDSNFML